MAQLRGAAESGGGAVCGAGATGVSDREIKVERNSEYERAGGLDRSVPGGSMVADPVEVSALREGVRQPSLDATLHQLRVEQG